MQRLIQNKFASVSRAARLLKILNFNWRSEAPLLVSGCAAMGLEIMARLMEPWPLKYIFDELLNYSDSGHQQTPLISNLSVGQLLAIASFAIIGISFLRATAEYVSTISLAIVGNRFLLALRARTFDHLQRLSLRFHDQAKTGDLVTRLVGDMGRIQEVGVTALLPIIVHLATLVVMVSFMIALNRELGFYTLIGFPVFFLFINRISGRIRSVAREQRRGEGRLGAASAEAMAAVRTVQVMGLEEAMTDSFGRQNYKNAQQSVKGKRLAAKLARGVDVMIAAVTALVLWRGTNLVLTKQLSPGDLLIFLAYLKNAFKPMKDMAKYSGRISGAIASSERIADILSIQPEITDSPYAIDPPSSIHSIEFSNVSFGYTDTSKALRNVSLQAYQDQLIALVGPSGAGKSTLMNLLCRLYDPSEGQVLFNGQDIKRFKLSPLRKLISIVPQDNILFNLSVRDNISIGFDSEDDQSVEKAAKLAGAHEFVSQLPQGYDTILAERGATLSGGQQRRLAIARAALRQTPILILDEPLSGLDASNRRMVSDAIQKLKNGRITFAIVHDLDAAQEADQVICMSHGMIVEKGTHQQLLDNQGIYFGMASARVTRS